jgi:hypothetical protein
VRQALGLVHRPLRLDARRHVHDQHEEATHVAVDDVGDVGGLHVPGPAPLVGEAEVEHLLLTAEHGGHVGLVPREHIPAEDIAQVHPPHLLGAQPDPLDEGVVGEVVAQVAVPVGDERRQPVQRSAQQPLVLCGRLPRAQLGQSHVRSVRMLVARGQGLVSLAADRATPPNRRRGRGSQVASGRDRVKTAPVPSGPGR